MAIAFLNLSIVWSLSAVLRIEVILKPCYFQWVYYSKLLFYVGLFMTYNGVHFEVIGPLNPSFGVISQIGKFSKGAPIYFAWVAIHFILFAVMLQPYTANEPMSLQRHDPFDFLINFPFFCHLLPFLFCFFYFSPLSHLAQMLIL